MVLIVLDKLCDNNPILMLRIHTRCPREPESQTQKNAKTNPYNAIPHLIELLDW